MHTFLIMKKKLGSELLPASHLIRVLQRSCQPLQPGKEGAAEGPGPAPDSVLSPCAQPHAPGIYQERHERISVMLLPRNYLFRNKL